MDIAFTDAAPESVDTSLLAVGVGADTSELATVDGWFGGHITALAERNGFTGKPGTTLTIPALGGVSASEVLLVGTGDRGAADLREAAARAGQAARKGKHATLALHLGDLGDATQGVLESVAVGNYAYEAYQSEGNLTPALEQLTVIGATATEAVGPATVRARWQAWARDLVNAPADEIYPMSLAERAQQAFADLEHVEVEVWDYDKLLAEDCVGIVAVGRGSDRKPCMIRIRYRPPGATSQIAFVGKGVTFDAGGLSIKPTGGMLTMRCDMGGSATVLGAAGAIAELGLPVAYDCFVGAAENLLDGNSYKLGDILRYRNGVTVEIHNTDAEGRLVMADCLIEASRVEGVTHLVDAATLTGAAVVALGGDFTALLTESDAFADDLLAAAKAEGEGLWRLPLHLPYNKLLKGTWGQIKNVGGREAGTITAGLYLRHFVDVPHWAHLDIAGPAFRDKGAGAYAPGATGQMVRTLVTWAESLG